MFRCHFCQQITPPGTKKRYVVIATREKQYPTRRRESQRARGRFRSRDDAVQDRGGTGRETAEEVAACPQCAEKQHEVKLISAQASPPAEAEVTPGADSQ